MERLRNERKLPFYKYRFEKKYTRNVQPKKSPAS